MNAKGRYHSLIGRSGRFQHFVSLSELSGVEVSALSGVRSLERRRPRAKRN